MNKQELINELNLARDSYSNENGFRSGVRTGLGIALGVIEKLDEPEKVVIPKNVAEQLEYWKRNKMNILWQFFLKEIPSSILSWLESDKGNYDKLIDAEKNGYEVEKEKLYYVINGAQQLMLVNARYAVPTLADFEVVKQAGILKKYQLTEEEIKKYDERYWSFAVEVAE